MLNCIILVGMATAGKSTVGALLAKNLDMKFIDTDDLIKEKYNKSIANIIEEEGIDVFLQKEEEAVLSNEYENMVIATGGSVIYSEKAIKKLKQCGKAVYLEISFDVLKERLKDIKDRGVVIKDSQSLEELYYERKSLYEKYADIIVSTNNNNLEEIVTTIINKISKE